MRAFFIGDKDVLILLNKYSPLNSFERGSGPSFSNKKDKLSQHL